MREAAVIFYAASRTRPRREPQRRYSAASGGHLRLDGDLCGQPFEHCPASIVDTGRARLRAIGKRLKQIGQFGVAVLRLEPLHVVDAAPIARRADDGELRRAEVR